MPATQPPFRVALLCGLAGAFAAAGAQRPPNRVVTPGTLVLDTLLLSPGPQWDRARSAHFVLYAERGDRPRYGTRALLDSLESAWTHAERLLGMQVPPAPPVPVFVTRTPARFPRLLAPHQKGLAYTAGAQGGTFILLVHNDSVRAHTRHEVMHVVSVRAWGRPAAGWVAEGVGTWADGRCQGTSALAVARDLLRGEPGLTAPVVTAQFVARAERHRASAYVLAASVIGYLYENGGTDALRRVWASGAVATPGATWTGDTVTARWRAYVERAAAQEPGLPPASLARHGCG
jgi:hypothetical protein